MSARNMAKRTAAGTLALAVCLGGGAIALAGAASADANFKFDQRIQGDDRYGTAIAASKAAFDKADNVILVNGYATVDGLTASYLAGVANAPILYVSDKGADDATKAEIKRLGAKNIWLVGGEKVIPASVADAIKGDGYSVTRINGSDRYETAALIAEAGIKISGKKPSTVFVASGTSFADALAVSPVAFVKGYPIILTDKDSTSDFSKKELGVIGTDSKVLVGGEAVVSKKVQADLSIKDEQRVAGSDRAVTANLVSDWAKKSQGFNPANAALVGGTNGNGADSLVAAPLLGKSFTTLHFAGWDATAVYMKDHAAQLTGKGFVFGGKAAVSDGQVSSAQSAAQTIGASMAFTTDATSAATIVGDTDTAVTADQGKNARTYTFNVGSQTNIAVALMDPTSVITAANGNVTFKSLGTVATAGSVGGARIISVNGAAVSVTKATSIAPVDGKVTIKVDGTTTAYGSAVPVVYVPTAGELAVDSSGTPKLAFGVGGAVTVIPVESPLVGSPTAYTVNDVNTSAGRIVATDSGSAAHSFRYSSGDAFRVGGNTVTQQQFFAALNAGDTLTITYNPAGADIYDLTTDIPGVPTIGRATLNDTNGDGTPDNVGLTFTNPDNVGISGYAFQIAKLTNGQPGTWSTVVATSTNGPTGNLTAGASINAVLPVPGSAGDYVYRARALGAGSGSDATVYSAASNAVTVAASPAAVTGIATNGILAFSDADSTGNLSVGDTIQVTFASGVVANGSATLKLINSAGQTVTITQGASTATFGLASSNTVLTVTLLAPAAVTGGSSTTFDVGTGSGKAIQVSALSGLTSSSDVSLLPNLHSATNGLYSAKGDSALIPAAPSAVSASAAADTITATTAAANSVIRVYDNTGALIATSPVVATAGPVTFAAGTNLVVGQKLLITQVNSSGIESPVASASGTTAS